jgi:hypothetical protein
MRKGIQGKRSLLVVLFSVILSCFAACGGDQEESQIGEKTTTNPSNVDTISHPTKRKSPTNATSAGRTSKPRVFHADRHPRENS